MAGPAYQFGDFRLDCGRFELLRDGQSIRAERKPMELLILLASRQGQLVTRLEIAQRLWSSEVFVDTEHGINTAIRKIRYILRDNPENPRFVQTVTGMGYRFIAPVVTEAAPLDAASTAIAAQPAEAIAPQPIATGAPPQSRSSHARRWLVLGAGTILVAFTLAVTLGPRPLAARLFHSNAPPAITSLAVLPLDNLSGDPSQDYFADGMTDELTTMLAKNSTLRIVSRTSVMQYKGARRPLRDIARELGVDGILEGSISHSNSQVHMTLQLIRADTDVHVWAESYDRDDTDVAALPNETAQAIAKRLHSSVLSASSARYVNPEAHDAYLHGRYLWYAGRNDKAFEYFKKATQLQSDYAPGWAGLSIYYGAGAVTGELNPGKSLVLSEAAAVRSAQLDDSLPEAHLALCAAIATHRWDWVRADQECKRAIELDPKFAEAYHLRAKILGALNRNDEAIETQKRATELDPFAKPFAMAMAYIVARKYDAAIENTRQRLEAYPQDTSPNFSMSDAYRRKGMNKEAAQTLAKAFLVSGDQVSAADVQLAFKQGGYKAVVRWQLSQLQKESRQHYVSPVKMANLYAQLGDRKQTLALLEEGYREHSPLLLFRVQSDPAFDFLHSDLRYRSIIQQIGLPPAY